MKKKCLIFSMALMTFTLAVLFGCEENYEPYLEIHKSLIPNAGNGVFATRPIYAGATLGHYKGKFITKEEHQQLMRENTWHYVMGLLDCAASHTGGYTRIDGRHGNVFTRMNYAPEEFQNVKFQKICDYPYVLIIALRDIEPGEELYVDYGTNYRYDFMRDSLVKEYFEKLRREKAARQEQKK